jgi:hypothetical protein
VAALDLRTQGGQDLAVVREAAGLMLGINEPPVGANVELALAARDRLGIETLSTQLGRETRGPCVIDVSGRAVVDLDAHDRRS